VIKIIEMLAPARFPLQIVKLLVSAGDCENGVVAATRPGGPMSRILMVTWDGAGNFPPERALVRGLLARGHFGPRTRARYPAVPGQR